jgi:hypothetical protein
MLLSAFARRSGGAINPLIRSRAISILRPLVTTANHNGRTPFILDSSSTCTTQRLHFSSKGDSNKSDSTDKNIQRTSTDSYSFKPKGSKSPGGPPKSKPHATDSNTNPQATAASGNDNNKTQTKNGQIGSEVGIEEFRRIFIGILREFHRNSMHF